ncbi:EAL domain-containing protein [Magnetospirillum molischianum]|uniref:EAL domain protein, diguanylate phosphodiesterase n=1 Tax=Magnetospirillum molischianum DSM 120 TaxID=1150626 RepID=H8FTC6_MAGML|nr:EAL domain-containing protein [Magnetospirillum molischianum]CCG41614.1 EAL domain protein, diguanylate phosphodiesterase [Magnetospirillum molischianum DSM 120]
MSQIRPRSFPGTAVEDLPASIIADILSQSSVGAEYQPLIEVNTGRIAAYEGLSRFRTRQGEPIAPDRVFKALHASPPALYEIEFRAKRDQIAHAPAGIPLFVNLDPDAFAAGGGEEADNPLMGLLSLRNDIGVEIIENCSVTDSRLSLAMLRRLRGLGVRVALDDIGGGDSLISFAVLAGIDDMKIARDWLDRRDDPVAQRLLSALAGFARDTGKRLIFEGIETLEDLAWAKRQGADLVQGFLYRPQFVTWQPDLPIAPIGGPNSLARRRRSELAWAHERR